MNVRDALRPFALFGLEGPPREFRIVLESPAGGEDMAVLTGEDFHNAWVAYARADPLCLKGYEASGGAVGRAARAARIAQLATPGVRLWPWLLLFFALGVVAGSRA